MRRRLAVLRHRVRSLFRGSRVERDLDRELRFHVEEHIAELVAAGASPDAARREALRQFGSVASIADGCRDTRRITFLSHFARDLRYGVRSLLRERTVFIAATASISLGVAANVAIFGLANSLLLSMPTASRPDRLVHVRSGYGSHAPYEVWRRLNDSGVLAGIAGHQIEAEVNWRGPESSIPIAPLFVTPNFFDVVGMPMAHGRGFTAAEIAGGAGPQLAVVSHRFWTRRLDSNPSVVGSTLMLNGQAYAIVGVTPPGIRSLPGYGLSPDIWLPITRALMPDLDDVRSAHVMLVGRLYDGQSKAEAHAALSTVSVRIGRDLGVEAAGHISRVTAVGGIDQMRDFKEVAAFFGVLLVVTLLVLGIACANVAGLLLARGTARRREIAVRLAIGASRRRIVQQLLTEGLILSVAGTLAGVLLTAAAGQLLPRISLPIPLPLELRLTFDTRLAWFATALVCATAILCGLAPAWQATRPAVLPALRQEAPAYVHRRFTLRNLLVMGQIAISVLLLVTTLLFIRNLALAHTLSPEFDAGRAVAVRVTFVEGRQGTRGAPAIEGMVERLGTLPGVEAAAFSDGLPLTIYSGRIGTMMEIEGRAEPVRVEYETNSVSPGYFRAMGIRLLRGRDFNWNDRRGAPARVIVNQEFVRRYFEGRDPIGLHVFLPTDPKPTPAEVIGIAADSKYRTIGEGREPALYGAYLQGGGGDRYVHAIVRTGAPQTMITPVREAILQMDGSAAVVVEPMTTALAFAFLPSRIGAAIVGMLGILGATLAMVGLAGVISFAVARRTFEIGVRLALGASSRSIVRLVLYDGGVLVGVGLAIGLGLAFLLTQPLAAFLVAELPARDPVSFAGGAVLLFLTCLAAAWGPARRATRVPPALALRAE